MHLTPNQWIHLIHTPARHTRGAPAKEICRAMHGTDNPLAVDRTILVLRQLSKMGMVQSPNSIYTFSRYFSRGYRRTEAGEALVEQHAQVMEGMA